MQAVATATLPALNKTLHLVRHAEAERKVVDPGLKADGWKQVEKLRKHLVATGMIREVELVVVSPLTRALQTAVGVFGGPLTLKGIGAPPPFVASELCRESVSPCNYNKRSPISKCKQQFPVVDFSQIKADEDILWNLKVREPRESLDARSRGFLEWLMDRKEKNIAVVSHAGFLSRLVSEHEPEEDWPSIVVGERRCKFLNCELCTVTAVCPTIRCAMRFL